MEDKAKQHQQQHLQKSADITPPVVVVIPPPPPPPPAGGNPGRNKTSRRGGRARRLRSRRTPQRNTAGSSSRGGLIDTPLGFLALPNPKVDLHKLLMGVDDPYGTGMITTPYGGAASSTSIPLQGPSGGSFRITYGGGRGFPVGVTAGIPS